MKEHEDALVTWLGPQGDAELAERVLARTRGPLRQRKALRAARGVVPLLAAFAIGLLLGRTEEAKAPPIANQSPVLAEELVPAPGAPWNELPIIDVEIHARSLESKDAAPFFRLAGDRWLSEADDIEAAVRCYRRYLQATAERDMDTKDTWLLASLKQMF